MKIIDPQTRLEKAYELYKKDWCRQRDFDPEEVAKADAEGLEYNGCMYASLEEFADCEYTDSEYIKELFEREANDKLYEKMSAEQEEFKAKILSLPSEKILEHAYEYAIREDILCTLENDVLTERQARAMLKSERPLTETYDRWMNLDVRYMDDIRDNLVSQANEVLRDEFLKSRRQGR